MPPWAPRPCSPSSIVRLFMPETSSTIVTDTSLDVAATRAQFPALALQQNGQPVVYFDNPGGTQVPRRVIDAIAHYMTTNNANTGGAFVTSVSSDAMLEEARAAIADLLGAADPREIVFGPN